MYFSFLQEQKCCFFENSHNIANILILQYHHYNIVAVLSTGPDMCLVGVHLT